MKNFLTWGVDGLFRKHYLCKYCGEEFGTYDNPEEIDHFCIKGCLVENDLTARQLAEKVGISHRTVQNWSQGRNKPSKITINYIKMIMRGEARLIYFPTEATNTKK